MPDSKSPNPFRKPREDFPLYPHRNGRWAERVHGQIKYFGKCADDPNGEAALNRWLDQKDDLLAGRTPRAGRQGTTVGELCDRFLQAKDIHFGDDERLRAVLDHIRGWLYSAPKTSNAEVKAVTAATPADALPLKSAQFAPITCARLWLLV